MQVVDNLVLLHSQAEGRSRIYDLQLLAKEPAVEVDIRDLTPKSKIFKNDILLKVSSFKLVHFSFFCRWTVQLTSIPLFLPQQFADR